VQPRSEPAGLELDVAERAGERPDGRVHDEAGIGVGAQTTGDQIAEGLVRPPPFVLVALGQLNRDFSHDAQPHLQSR